MSVCEQCVGIESVLECVSTYLIVDLVDVIREYLEREYIIGKPVEWDEKRVRREKRNEKHLHEYKVPYVGVKVIIVGPPSLNLIGRHKLPLFYMNHDEWEGSEAHRIEVYEELTSTKGKRYCVERCYVVPKVLIRMNTGCEDWIVLDIWLGRFRQCYGIEIVPVIFIE